MRQMYLPVVLVLVLVVGHEGLRVRGSSGPLVAQLGGSVLLPCFIESPLPLEDLQVEWRKMESDSLVSVFLQGESRPDLQSQQFRGRVGVFPDEILKGNFSILLKNVVEEDAGGYRCQVNTSQGSSEVVMEIKNMKSLVVTGADRAVFAHEGDDVILNCSVDSHIPASEIEEVAWKRIDRDQEILVLLYQDSEIFPDSSHERYRGRVDLFPSEIPKGNFSLKLMDVKMEDKGEFVCEVHTRNTSGRTVVLLQGVGFSAVHIVILVLCAVAVLLAVGFCGPVFILLRNGVSSKKGMKRHISLILWPNICMFVTFILWSTEGLLSEVIACSAVSIMRPIILMKTSPYLGIFPHCLQRAVKALAFPLYHSTITMAACSIFFENLTRVQSTSGHIITVLVVLTVVIVISAVVLAIYELQIYLTVCLEIFNLALLGILLSKSNSNFDYSVEIPSVIKPQIMGLMMVLFLQRHLVRGKPFRCVHVALPSVILAIFSLSIISVYVLLSITVKDFAKGWILLFQGLFYIFAWLAVIYLVCCRQSCCSQWRKIGDRSGYLALLALVHILSAACLFKHPKYLPEFLQIMIYMFGAVVLTTVNAIALATELILKAGKGARTVEDLRLVVFPLEAVFLLAWISLQIYDAWMRLKDRTRRNFGAEEGTGPEVISEMEVLSEPGSKR